MCCTRYSAREAETELQRGLELAGFLFYGKKKNTHTKTKHQKKKLPKKKKKGYIKLILPFCMPDAACV